MNEDRYCFICDTKITEEKIEGIKRPICKKCLIITGGYNKKEEYFVKELRAYFREDEYYKIGSMVWILRKYLDKLEFGKVE